MTDSLRIIILEDNPSDADLIQFELQEGGFACTTKVVATEKDFIQELQTFCPDLILSDYDLPTYNGALALAEANKRCPDTPFILVTGAVTEDRAIEILTQGAKDYVLKSRLQRLLPAVHRALSEAVEIRARKKAEEELRKAHRELELQAEKRTAELHAVLDAAPIAIWIAHDPKCQQITGNTYANDIIMRTPHGSNVSRSAAPGEAAVSYKVFRDGVELSPEELPAQVATATGKPVRDVELELVFSDGRHVHLIEAAVPLFDTGGRVRGAVITGSDITKHKQAETALRQVDERQRLVLQSSSMGTFEVDLLTGEGQWNATEFDLLGLKPGDVEAGPDAFFRFVHPDDVGRLRNQWEDATRSGKLDTEFRVVGADGRVRWLVGKGQFFFDGKLDEYDSKADKKALRFTGVNYDITERKQVEEALLQITERFDMAQHAAQIGSWDWDISTGRIEWSTQMFELFRIDPEKNSASFAVWESVLYPDDIKIAGLRIDQALKQRMPLNSDYRIVLPDGRIRWINSRGMGKYDDQGRPIRMIGVCMDITERKRMEDDLRKAKDELEERIKERTSELQAASHYARSLIEASIDPLVTINVDGKIMDVNHASEEATGFTRLKLIGTDFSDYFMDPVKARIGYEKAFREGFVRDYPLQLRHPDGHVASVIYNARVYRDELGKIMGVFAAARDITERMRAEEALQRAYDELERRVEERTLELTKRTAQLEATNKELESFSYSVSHDLRVPLRAIDGYSRILLREQGDKFDENTKNRFNVIRNNVKLMDQLINDLLALSRLGRDALSMSRLNIEDLSRDAWNELQTINPDRPVDLKIDPVPLAIGDRSLIRQVLINLLSNAVKFSRVREVPLIEIGGLGAEGMNVYYVRDNGVGFDMQYHDKLFGVFQRLHSAADFEGTGVGLAIVWRIIHRHGGRIWAEGEVDKGATFYFTLPNSQG